jgi:hypothetical protein
VISTPASNMFFISVEIGGERMPEIGAPTHRFLP